MSGEIGAITIPVAQARGGGPVVGGRRRSTDATSILSLGMEVVAETSRTREVIRRWADGGDAMLVAHPWSGHVQPL